jgi:hypothetical protein
MLVENLQRGSTTSENPSGTEVSGPRSKSLLSDTSIHYTNIHGMPELGPASQK